MRRTSSGVAGGGATSARSTAAAPSAVSTRRAGTIALSGCAKFKADVPRCPCGKSTLKRAISRCFDCCRKAGIENPREMVREWI